MQKLANIGSAVLATFLGVNVAWPARSGRFEQEAKLELTVQLKCHDLFFLLTLPRKPVPVGASSSVKQYYSNIDNLDYEKVIDFFAENATYVRGDWDPFIGKSVVEKFFTIDRKLRGNHLIDSVEEATISGVPGILVTGSFKGTNGASEVSLKFKDFWVFDDDGKIIYRQSWISSNGV